VAFCVPVSEMPKAFAIVSVADRTVVEIKRAAGVARDRDRPAVVFGDGVTEGLFGYA
jgi:hypothetical protein